MRRVFRTMVWMALIAGSLWMGGFLAFLDRPMMDKMTASDAAVVLTGGAGRIDAAVALLQDNKVERVLISGVNIQVSQKDLEHVVGIDPIMLACCIDLGRAAQNTKGNAYEAAHWARTRHYESLVVVTADYHMPRAMLIFASAMPDITLTPYAVAAPATLYGRAKEYSKYLLTLVAMRLGLY